MTTTTPLTVFGHQDVELEFTCYERDGVTPYNCTGGVVEIRFWNEVVDYRLSSEDPSWGLWSDQAKGRGLFIIPKAQMEPGFYEYQLRATKQSGRTSIQARSRLAVKDARS